jgi:hypothetical protein
VERDRGNLEADAGQHQHQPELGQHLARGQRRRNGAHRGGARHAVDEREAVQEHRGRNRPDEEEFQRPFRRDVLPLLEAGEEVERDRHQLERHEQQDQLAR